MILPLFPRISLEDVDASLAILNAYEPLIPALRVLLSLDRTMFTEDGICLSCKQLNCYGYTGKCQECGHHDILDNFVFACEHETDNNCICDDCDDSDICPNCERIGIVEYIPCKLDFVGCKNCGIRFGMETHIDDFGRDMGRYCWFCHIQENDGLVELDLEDIFRKYPDLTEESKNILSDYIALLNE